MAAERCVKGKRVVVTGGASGIGYDIADKFLQKGANLTILDLNPTAGARAVENLTSKHGPGRAIFVPCDITNESDMNEVFAKVFDCGVDVLVNNAGVISERNWKRGIDVNLTYLVGWSLKFWDHMRRDKTGRGGTIVNIASIYGFRIARFMPVYQASKFGVYGFTKSLGHEYNYNRTGVRVIGLCPGFTRTELTEAFELQDQQMKEDFSKKGDVLVWQDVEAVGSAAVHTFEISDSGKMWLIEGGKPIVEV